jgi:polysaccharide export outer membrane protein
MKKVCETLLALAFAFFPSYVGGQTSKHVFSSFNENPTSTSASPGLKQNAPRFRERSARYRVQSQDVLSISFALSPELDKKTVTVERDGYIALPGTQAVYIQGLTVPEIVDAVKHAYAGILHDPIIEVDLVDFQRPMFTVLGQVNRPGAYDLRRDITITEAVATAGGFNAGAKTQVLLLRRVSRDWSEVRKLNLKQILRGKNTDEDIDVQPGDIVFVPEKAITILRKYVPYGVSANPSSWAAPL